MEQVLYNFVTENGGPAARRSKANKETRLVERKVCFILEAGSQGGRRTPVQRPAIGGKSFYRRRERAETAQAALTGILKLVMQWSDQWHLDCFKYSESLVPESVFSHFFEASSQNCGLYHGYSLVIM